MGYNFVYIRDGKNILPKYKICIKNHFCPPKTSEIRLINPEFSEAPLGNIGLPSLKKNWF